MRWLLYRFLDVLTLAFGERRVLLWCANVLEWGGAPAAAADVRERVRLHE